MGQWFSVRPHSQAGRCLNQVTILLPEWRMSDLCNGPEQVIAATLGVGSATGLRVNEALRLGRPDHQPDRAAHS